MTGSTRIKHRSTGAPDGGPWPFQTDAEVIAFAKRFLRDRARGFKKDIDICLTGKTVAGGKRTHAYMPALLLCFSFVDLLSALYAGKIKGHGLPEFRDYMLNFTPKNRYKKVELEILYVGFRHKIAHLSHPYFVLNTANEKKISGSRKRVAWSIYASKRTTPLELVPMPAPEIVSSHPTPWPVSYDHRLKVSIPMLATDARKSLWGPHGYIAKLRVSRGLRSKFMACMEEFHPK